MPRYATPLIPDAKKKWYTYKSTARELSTEERRIHPDTVRHLMTRHNLVSRKVRKGQNPCKIRQLSEETFLIIKDLLRV